MKNYSEVKYYETVSSIIEGGMHVCTTDNEVLFNLNDLFDLLQLEKPKRDRWKKKLRLNINNSQNFKRNNRSTCEAFIDMNDVAFILSLYGNELINQLKIKMETEKFINKILRKYSVSKDINYNGVDDLSYEFALETLKLFSDNHDGELDNIIDTLKRYNISERIEHTINFNINDNEQEEINDDNETEEYTLDWVMKQVEKELKENK